jgi:long-subunit acyl-CoA synthetase (AMP-forming)
MGQETGLTIVSRSPDRFSLRGVDADRFAHHRRSAERVEQQARCQADRRGRGTFTFASTPFLSDLSNTVEKRVGKVASLRYFVAAGAPIPGVLVERATKTLGANIISAWGMTDNGAVTRAKPRDADAKPFITDGRLLPGIEVKVFGANGNSLEKRGLSQGTRLLQLHRLS